MQAVKVKICGLTREQDVHAAVEAGADAVGFVLTRSPRQITAAKARELSRLVPTGILKVGLFLNQSRAEVEQVLNTVELDVLQFHGTETAEQCRRFDLPYLKAVSMLDNSALQIAAEDYPDAFGLLLDSHVAGRAGGSGKVFDWSLISHGSIPVWLAGGLNPDNVAAAVQLAKPFAVDVSSGVESSPGIKSKEKIVAFIKAARS